MFLLRPDKQVEQIYLYCLAEAARRFGITVYGWVAMSNHQHLLVRDNRGNLPAFLAHFNKLTAKALNDHWGRWENLWSSEQTNVVWIVDPQDAFEKLIYVLANPVTADLVDRISDWPGAISLRQNLSGEPITIVRPAFFREDGPMPAEVTLRVERLPGFEHLSVTEWESTLRSRLEGEEAAARKIRFREGRTVLGRKAVLDAACTDRPETVAPRRRLRPHLACSNAQLRRAALCVLQLFRTTYRTAMELWLSGDKATWFPPGTYKMALLGACCRPTVDLVAV
ncbi:hypothetical protein AKJ09_08493 [Labilithrix luteola]|uniref:Transposase IS200-like domain-containing protein n=1 Tax=Labilithrix luteola TaxID=1391654 RepID=A0A0K1Q8U6_9BACT|nr:hypothetical protein AKJ09_08493 [Labilithrix luteola]